MTTPTDYTPAQASPNDPMLAHEALDRTHVVLCILAEHLIEHPYFQNNPALKGMANRAAELLAQLYQCIGRSLPAEQEAKP